MFEWVDYMFRLSPSWQARGERRKVRWLRRLFIKEPKIQEKIQKAIEAGSISKVVKAYHQKEKIEKKELEYTFLVLKKMRIIFKYHIDTFEKIKEEIKKDNNLTQDEKKELGERINKEIELTKDIIKALFRGEENIRIGGQPFSMKQILTRGSLLNDFYFLARQERKYVRKSIKDEKKILSALEKSVKNEKIKELFKKLEEDFKKETSSELKEEVDALVNLFEVKRDLEKGKKDIIKLVEEKGFPKSVAEEKLLKNEEGLFKALKDLINFEDRENRYLLGEEYRAEKKEAA